MPSWSRPCRTATSRSKRVIAEPSLVAPPWRSLMATRLSVSRSRASKTTPWPPRWTSRMTLKPGKKSGGRSTARLRAFIAARAARRACGELEAGVSAEVRSSGPTEEMDDITIRSAWSRAPRMRSRSGRAGDRAGASGDGVSAACSGCGASLDDMTRLRSVALASPWHRLEHRCSVVNGPDAAYSRGFFQSAGEGLSDREELRFARELVAEPIVGSGPQHVDGALAAAHLGGDGGGGLAL